MRRFFKRTKTAILHALFRIVSFFTIKDENLWVFGAWAGKAYIDNSKYFFEYCQKHYPDKKYVWITRNDEARSDLSSKGLNVVKIGTFEWFRTILKASVLVVSCGAGEIGGFFPSRCTAINLWHGYGGKMHQPDKAIGATIVTSLVKLLVDNVNWYYWMAPSEYSIEILSIDHGVNKEQCYITGQPRDDYIKSPIENNVVSMLKEKHKDCNRIIAYMPTWRSYYHTQCQPKHISDSEFDMINEYCKGHGYLFLYKPHFSELEHFANTDSRYSNVEIANINQHPEYLDLYSYLGGLDLLICDYSSVIFDFLYADKPVVLFPYDLERYNEKNGVPYDYFEDPCGPVCYNWNEVLKAIDDIYSNDQWVEARKRKKKLTHFYDDTQNCERIYRKVFELRNNDRKHIKKNR